ncbi:MAG TPA: ArsA family ATPase [Methylomirabilota bacterium]|nr:ArsA family ATPase [Methylomirabilota bacterium]
MSPRFTFFGGKGGVGKTTCAAAAALGAAERGRRVLLVSTDPAHSLSDAVDTRLSARPRALPARRGVLRAVELDADRALERWIAARRRPLAIIAERGTYLDEDDIDRFLRLSLPGVDELIGLVELTRLARAGPSDEVVVDTAPTGHTLRLLAMPETLRRIASVLSDMHAKHRFLAASLGARYRPDTADALIAEIDAEGTTLAALLRDPARCAFRWILLPETLSLEEARDGVRALEASGIAVEEIVVNGVTPDGAGRCAACAARIAGEREVLAGIHAAFPRRPIRLLPALAHEPRGLPALRAVARALAAPVRPLPVRARARRATPRRARAARTRPTPAAAAPWLRAAVPDGVRLVAFAGKGGVGKTSCAAATALAFAARHHDARVLLLSTDPAHSLADVFDVPLDDEERPVPGAPAGLRVREMDADRAFQQRREGYRKAVDELFDALTRGSRMDVAFDREVVQQLIDLAPPGLDEVFAILSVIDALLRHDPPPYDVVVLDTAPTGHALRLLRMPAAALEWVHALIAILLKYRRVLGLGELAADLVEIARELRELQALLRDPARARVVAVARAGALPERETVRLLRALSALGITVGAIVVNAVRAAACPGCRHAADEDRKVARRLRAAAPSVKRGGCAMISAPAEFPPPRGVAALTAWAERWECDA